MSDIWTFILLGCINEILTMSKQPNPTVDLRL